MNFSHESGQPCLRMMDLGAILIGRSTVRTKDLVRMDLTRHRSAKKVIVPARLTQPLGGTKISLERMEWD
jgi:hypothetical protein